MSFLKADETGDILMSDPVAWMDAYDHTNLYYRKPQQVDVVPLYTHPPAAQPEPPDFSKDGQMGAVNIAIKEYAKNYARAALPDGWLQEAERLVDEFVFAVLASRRVTEARVALIAHLRLAEGK